MRNREIRNNIRRYFVVFVLLSLCSQITYGQRYIKKMDRWSRKHKYEKIARKVPRLIKNHPDEAVIYFYAAYSEMKLSEKCSSPQKGYRRILNSIKYYNIYQAKMPESQISSELKMELHTQTREYYKYFEKTNNVSSLKVLDVLLANTFKDTTESYILFLISKGSNNSFFGSNTVKYAKDKVNKYHEDIVLEAIKHEGKPYKYGADGPDKFDCSGFTRYVYLVATGYELPHSSSMQAELGKEIIQKDALPGDLVFFGNPKTRHISHTGIVLKIIGDEVTGVIHCTNSGVTIDTEEKASWTKHWKSKIVKFVTIEDLLNIH